MGCGYPSEPMVCRMRAPDEVVEGDRLAAAQLGGSRFRNKVDEAGSAAVLEALDNASASEDKGSSLLQLADTYDAQWSVPPLFLWGVHWAGLGV